jgi:hypothetical protein
VRDLTETYDAEIQKLRVENSQNFTQNENLIVQTTRLQRQEYGMHGVREVEAISAYHIHHNSCVDVHRYRMDAIRESLFQIVDQNQHDLRLMLNEVNQQTEELEKQLTELRAYLEEQQLALRLEAEKNVWEKELALAEEKKEEIMHRCRHDPRQEELGMIDRLENILQIRELQLAEATRALVNYKKKIVEQEDSYNVRFGSAPTVGVLRPQTSMGLRPSTGARTSRKKMERPVSTLSTSRSVNLYANRHKLLEI